MKDFVKIEFECLCNLNCDYCHAYNNKYKLNVKKVLNEIERIILGYDPQNVYFRVEGIGEITLYPEILEFLNRKAKKDRYQIEVLSNGLLVDQYIDKMSSLIWVISLDGTTTKMNSHRNIKQAQLDRILQVIVKNNLEIQCVYYEQSIDEINEYIKYLEERNYKGFLHISPRKYHDRPLQHYLDYDKLYKTDFIPDEDYFKRWKSIIDKKCRDFTCEFFVYGYVYRIMRGEENTRLIKCDCANFEFEKQHNSSTTYGQKACGTCICQFEYDVKRKLKL